MNILLSISDLHVGGAQRLVVALANQLVAVHHQVYLYNYNLSKRQQRDLTPQLAADIKVYCLPWWLLIVSDKLYWLLAHLGISRHHFLWTNSLRSWHLNYILRRNKIDIISSHLFDADYLISTVLRTLTLNNFASAHQTIPLVVTDHGDYQYLFDQQPSYHQAIQTVLSQTTAVVCVAQRNLTNLQQLGVTNELCKIYNGIALDTHDFNMRAHLALPSGAFVFGMVSRGIPEKGWVIAIQALDLIYQTQLAPPNVGEVHLVLVGDSAYLRGLKQQLSPLLRSVVHFVGHADSPLNWIKDFDVGLLPSCFAGESLPMVIAEYLSQRKPVIASNVGGIAEMIDHPPYLAGTLLEPNPSAEIDPQKLAQAMRRYLQSPQLLEKQATDAAVIFQKKFHIQTCVAAYESLFEQIVKPVEHSGSKSGSKWTISEL